MIRFIFLSALSILFGNISYSQSVPSNNYPKDDFIWPVATTPALSANFGELRPNHYHMGMDMKTNERENLKVFAAADGYIAKIKIEPFGFGRCIYINHPNGLTTLYAHLNDFNPELENFLKIRQYAERKWRIFIEDIPPGKFKVKKGAFIAYSGNTGGSQGPHLHFEIRDTKTDKVLNPLLFKFPIEDNIKPDIARLAIYDRRTSVYEQSPKMISVKKSNGIYRPATNKIIVNTNQVSFGLTSFDKYTGSTNQNGIFKAIVYDNEKAVCQFILDSISYDETRFLNAHIDYKTKLSGGPYIQLISQLPGYSDGIYNGSKTDGIIHLDDESLHHIKIEVFDANGNKSTLQFDIQSSGTLSKKPMPTGILFKTGHINIYESEHMRFYLSEDAIYDSFHFTHSDIITKGKLICRVNNPLVPVHSYFSMKIKPEQDFTDTAKIIMKRTYGAKDDYKKAYFSNGWYSADFREFGDFELIEDQTPPVISPIGFINGMNTMDLSRIRFLVSDNTEYLKSFIGLLDGEWLLFSNDKGKLFTYDFDEHCSKGEHNLKIIAEDLAGNKTEKNYTFTR